MSTNTVIPTATLSIITSNKGNLCKEFSLDADNAISKLTHGNLYDGSIKTVELTLSELKSTIETLPNKQALCIGTRKPEFEQIAKLTIDKKVVAGESIARSKNFLELKPQPALMFIDYDDKELTPTELHRTLLEIVPELVGVGFLLVPSSSAGVYRASEPAPAVTKAGCHIYSIIDNGEAIPIIGEFIKCRAWLADHGKIEVSASGAMLERHLFDDAVYSPERLIFDAPPLLNSDLAQVPRELIEITGGMIQSDIFTLTTAERAELKNKIDLAKSLAKPESDRKRNAFKKAGMQKLIESGCTRERAEKVIEQRFNGVLSDPTELRSQKYGVVTVGEVLAHPDKFKGDAFIDPDETDAGTNYRAKVFFNDNGSVRLHSFRHGGCNYILEVLASKPTEIIPLDKPIPDFAEFAPHTTLKGKKLVPMPVLENLQCLADCYGIKFEYDELLRKKNIHYLNARTAGDLANEANTRKLMNLCTLSGLSESVIDKLPVIFEANHVNPILDWIKSREWDGTDRLPTLLDTITLVHPTDRTYAESIIKTWLIQCVASADYARSTPISGARPKFENVLIFCSGQGGNKTDWFESLLPVPLRIYHTKGICLDLNDKDSVFEATSGWIAELGELDATFRRSDLSRLKAFLSKSIDEIRRPYARESCEYKRRTSFCATVNDTQFLHDTTGNRRYLPLEILNCDKHHTVDMQQLWAQVWHQYLNGVKWWYDADDAMLSEVIRHQRDSMDYDPIISKLIAWYGGELTPTAPSDLHIPNQMTVLEICRAFAPWEREVTKTQMGAVRSYLKERGLMDKSSNRGKVFTLYLIPKVPNYNYSHIS